MGRLVLYARPTLDASFSPTRLKELEPLIHEAIEEMLQQGFTAKLIPGIEYVSLTVEG